jgi:hypothetical protein
LGGAGLGVGDRRDFGEAISAAMWSAAAISGCMDIMRNNKVGLSSQSLLGAAAFLDRLVMGCRDSMQSNFSVFLQSRLTI